MSTGLCKDLANCMIYCVETLFKCHKSSNKMISLSGTDVPIFFWVIFQFFRHMCSKVIITSSSLLWKSISPSKWTKFCFRALSNIPTTLLDILVYLSNKRRNVTEKVPSGCSSPIWRIIWHNCFTSWLIWAPANLPRVSVLDPATGRPYSLSSSEV